MKNFKKLVFVLFLYNLFFIRLSVLEAEFKTYWPGKELHISSASSKFLKKMVPDFQILLHEKHRYSVDQYKNLLAYAGQIIKKLDCFSSSKSLVCGDDIQALGDAIFQARSSLIMFVKSDIKTKSFRPAILIQKEIAQNLNEALKEVYIGTAKSDLEQIRNFLKNPKQDQIIYIYGLIQEIIRHFDGVAITEYDFIILTQCTLFLLLIA